MRVLEVFVLTFITIAAAKEISCIGNTTYQVKECNDQFCEPKSMKVGICKKEGQILNLGGKENIICQSPSKVCGSLESKLSNRLLDEDQITDSDDDKTKSETQPTVEIATTPTVPVETTKPDNTKLPTTINPTTTESVLPDIPIDIPNQANETVSSAVKQIQELTTQLINSGKLKPTEISQSVQNAVRKEYEKLPIPTLKSTNNFISLMSETSSKTIKFENSQLVDMSSYDRNIELENVVVNGNSNNLVIQPIKKSKNEKRLLQDEDVEALIQLHGDSSNIIYENAKINIISRDYINQNKPIIIQNCSGIFKSLKDSIIRNIEVNIYNDIIFNCKNNEGNDFGIFTNNAVNVTFINVLIKFNYNGVRTISINSEISNTNCGLLTGKSKDSSFDRIHIYGNIITVKGMKEEEEDGKSLKYGNLIGSNSNSNITNCYIDLSFVLLYQNIIYGGIIGINENSENTEITDSYVYISNGIRIGVDNSIQQFIYGGLVGKSENSNINIISDWISLNTLGIEINSTKVNFGGIIGVGDNEKVSISKSTIKMMISHSKFYLHEINTKNSGYIIGNNVEIEFVNSTAYIESCNILIPDCLSPIMSYKAGESYYPTKKTDTRILKENIENNYVYGSGVNEKDYEVDNGITKTPPQDYCLNGNLENGICFYNKYTPNNRPAVPTSYLILSTEGMKSKISSNSKLLCPNRCNLNGICQYGQCRCYPGFTSYDCKLRTCPYGSPISNPSNEYEKDKRINYECSNQGKCNRENGLCECFNGFEGNACQRTKCPNQCNNHGICTTVSQAILYKENINDNNKDNLEINYNKKYNKWDNDLIQLCVCDKEYTGVDCSIRKCPNGYLADSECDSLSQSEIKVIYKGAELNDMKTNVNEDKYLVYLKYTDPNGNIWFTNSFAFHLRDEWLKALGSLPSYAISIEGVEIDKTVTDKMIVTITFSKHQTGRQYPIEIIGTKETKDIPELSDVNNGFYHWINPKLPNLLNTEGDSIKYEMEYSQRGYECSNNGICNTKTGICNCFDGFSGLSCSVVEETF